MTQIERTTGEPHPLDVRGAKPGKGGDAPAFAAMLTSLADDGDLPVVTTGAGDGKAAAEVVTDGRKPHAAKGDHDDAASERDGAASDAKADAPVPAADPVGAIAMMLAAAPRADGASARGGDPSAEDGRAATSAAEGASATLADWDATAGIGEDGAEADAALDAFASAAVQAGLKGLAGGAGSASVVDRRTHFAPVQSRAFDSAARAPDAARTPLPEPGQGAAETIVQGMAAAIEGDPTQAAAGVRGEDAAVAARPDNATTPAPAADGGRVSSHDAGTTIVSATPLRTEPAAVDTNTAPPPPATEAGPAMPARARAEPSSQPSARASVPAFAPAPRSNDSAPASATPSRAGQAFIDTDPAPTPPTATPSGGPSVAIDTDTAPSQPVRTAAPLAASDALPAPDAVPAPRTVEVPAPTPDRSRTEPPAVGAAVAHAARTASSTPTAAPSSGPGLPGAAGAPQVAASPLGIAQEVAAQQNVAAQQTVAATEAAVLRPASNREDMSSLRDRRLSDDTSPDADRAVLAGRTAAASPSVAPGEGVGRVSEAAGNGAGRDGVAARREATAAATRENASAARPSSRTAQADALANDRPPAAPSAGTLAAASPTGPTSGALPATQLQRLAGAIAAGAADLTAQTGAAAAAALEPASLAAARDPVRTLDLQMHPATLGLVTVRMRLVGQSLELRVRAANPETARLLKADGGKLADLLSTSGYGTHILAIDAGGADTAGFISSLPQPSTGLADGGATWSGTGDQSRQQDRPSGGDGNGAPRGRSDFAGLTENADETSSGDRPGAVYV